MFEIYLISRLTAIQNLFTIIAALDCFLFVFSIIFLFIISSDGKRMIGTSREDEYRYNMKLSKRLIRWTSSILVISVIGTTFIPTTKEALFIYGVGNTVDFIKSNPTAKQLPDKCVKALDRWVDSLNDNTEENDTIK